MLALQLFVVLLTIICTGCSRPDGVSSVAASDLVGVWKLKYAGKVVSDNPDGAGYGVETLQLKPDGTYEQRFDDLRGGSYSANSSTWRVSKNFKKRPVVILSSLRYYPHGVARALAEDRPVAASLLVETSSSVPFIGRKVFILCFEEADVNLCFHKEQ